MLYLSSWRDLQRWSQATAFWLFDKPEITPLPIPTNVETAPAILITGGNSGLGREMALAFRDAGARVAIGSRRVDRNAAVTSELGGSCAAYELDVTDERSVEQMVKGVADRFGRLDVLINNAGTVNRASVMALERAAWDHVLATNLTGVFLCTKHAAAVMSQQRSGCIINIASLYGLMGPSKGLLGAYTAAKHGVIGLTRANAIELAPSAYE